MARIKFITVKGSEMLGSEPFYIGLLQHERTMGSTTAIHSPLLARLDAASPNMGVLLGERDVQSFYNGESGGVRGEV